MSMENIDREQEIQRQFLDEAQEYIHTLATALASLSQGIETETINAALRAAHSIKGGAGMMGFSTLSNLAHRLEDSLKVLKIQRNAITVDADLDHWLLLAVERLQQVSEFAQQDLPLDPQWLAEQVNPVFEQLHDRLGEPEAEDAYSILSPEDGQDVLPLLFQTEVEDSLNRLEQALLHHDPGLTELVNSLTEELGGIGEMLQLTAFVQLCESVKQHLTAVPERLGEIAQAALQSWRRSQALILTQHLNELPDRLTVAGISLPSPDSTEVLTTVEHLTSKSWTTDRGASPTKELTAALRPEIEEPNGNPGLPDAQPIVHTTAPTDPDVLPPLISPITSGGPELQPSPEAKPNSPAPDASDNTVRVSIKQLDRLNDLFGELTIERNSLDLNLKRLRGLMRTLTQRLQTLEQSNTQLRDVYDQVAVEKPNGTNTLLFSSLAGGLDDVADSRLTQAGLVSRFDTLELDRYDDVHLLSQEVIETIVQIQEVASDLELGLDEAEQTARELHKTARHLQTHLTQVRMRPLSDITDRFPRALRELALQYGKPVQFQVEGANTLIDRHILDALNEPLLHLVRNAFDHGIELPETRQAWGKPEQGTITIRAFQQNNRTWITVSDDGGGIPLDKIRARARQMGLDPMLLAAASDEELLSLIFEPGFSTSEQVTTLSGRGIGMDVVRQRLRQVQGEISVDTQAGLGTTFTLSVPFTLSVMRVLIAESNGFLMAFPTTTIQEMVMLAPEQVITTAGNLAFSWHDTMVQLIRLKQWLKFFGPRPLDNLEGTAVISLPTVLLVSQGSQIVGLEVDRCWGEQEVAIRTIQGGPPLPAGFSHGTILGDGRVVPLVSVPDLLRWLTTCQRSQIDASTDAASVPATPPQALTFPRSFQANLLPATARTVLIVDDSINVRRFLALTLEKAGYQVIQAKDGQEALDKLASDIAVQAIVCDIEMPRLDGYGFLARLKANPAYDQLPVAMLTTRSSDKHRQLALSLGATAYFSKPFNEQVLLQALEKMVAVG